MNTEIQHPTLGKIEYNESFWTGRKQLYINGTQLNKTARKTYVLPDGRTAILNGNFLLGATIQLDGQVIRLSPAIKWYEILLAVISFALILTWGNVVELCLIVPVVGGAIGGFLSALISMAGLLLMRTVKPAWAKVLIGIATIGVCFGVCAGVGFAIVAAH